MVTWAVSVELSGMSRAAGVERMGPLWDTVLVDSPAPPRRFIVIDVSWCLKIP